MKKTVVVSKTKSSTRVPECQNMLSWDKRICIQINGKTQDDLIRCPLNKWRAAFISGRSTDIGQGKAMLLNLVDTVLPRMNAR